MMFTVVRFLFVIYCHVEFILHKKCFKVTILHILAYWFFRKDVKIIENIFIYFFDVKTLKHVYYKKILIKL